MTSPSSYQTTLPKTFKKLLYKILPLPLLALPLSRTHTNLGKSLKSSDLTKVWKQIFLPIEDSAKFWRQVPFFLFIVEGDQIFAQVPIFKGQLLFARHLFAPFLASVNVSLYFSVEAKVEILMKSIGKERLECQIYMKQDWK